MKTKCVLVVDPGSQKTGMAVLDFSGNILVKKNCSNKELLSYVQELDQNYFPQYWIFGNKGAGRKVREELNKINIRSVEVFLADEHRSSEEGRKLFWTENSPRGWKKLLPLGLQTPDQPWDDWAAVVIGRRWLDNENQK